MIRILIDLFFLIMISIIKIIITINNNSNSHKLLKNNNVRYLKLVNLYKSSAKTQTNLLSRIKINLVNKTQTSTAITIKIRLNLTIMNFKDDPFLLKHISIMSKIKKMNYREMSKQNIMFTKTLFTRIPFIKRRNFTIITTIIIVPIKKLRIRILWKHIFLRNSYNLIAIDFVILISCLIINYTSTFASPITNLDSR